MLASFRFGNLGLFPKDHRLDFKTAKNSKGHLGIFVGASATGKSSCLEFIRRCLSEKVNHSKSRVYNPEKPGWALISFRIDRYTLYKYGIQNTEEGAFGDLGTDDNILTLWAGVIFDDRTKCTIRFIQLDKHDGKVCSIKAVTSQTDENPRAVYQRYGKPVVINDEIPLPYPEDLLDTDAENDQIIEDIYCSILGEKGLVISVFDQRGVGAIASTRNMKSGPEAREENYSTSEERAMFVKDLLREVDAREKRNEYEKLSTRLTGFLNWKFEITESGKLKVINSDSPGRPVDILKVPTGVYEAHLISLLFTTTDDFSTVMIDDPSRGMHWSMKENLREIIIDLIRNRHISVIISTQEQEFISYDTWDNIYRFSRCICRGTLLCHHLPTSGIENLAGFCVDEIRKWFFASSLILVEGKTDRIVIKAMLDRLRADDSHLCHHLVGAKVIACNGCINIGHVYQLVQEFGVPIIRIYDGDAYAKVASGNRAIQKMQFTENQRKKLNEKGDYQEAQYVDTCKDVTNAIRVLLNKSYVLQNAGSDSYYLDKKAIEDFNFIIRPNWKNLNNLLENLEECREGLQFMYKLISDATALDIHTEVDVACKKIQFSLSELKPLLLVERLLSPVWDLDDKSNLAEMPFFWGCGTIEDVINFTINKKFHDSIPPRPWFIRSNKTKGNRKNCIWYCQKNTFGKIDDLSQEVKTEIIDMLLGDKENTYFQKFLNHFNETYQCDRLLSL